MGKRRHFGAIRRLPSGRYQARYLGPDGLYHAAPETFELKADAAHFLSIVEAQLARVSTLAHSDFASQQSLDQAEHDVATARAGAAEAEANHAAAVAGP